MRNYSEGIANRRPTAADAQAALAQQHALLKQQAIAAQRDLAEQILPREERYRQAQILEEIIGILISKSPKDVPYWLHRGVDACLAHIDWLSEGCDRCS